MSTLTYGVWHRPFERTIDEVKTTLKELKSLGISEIFIETYYNGQLIYPSKHGLLPMHPWVGTYGIYGSDLLDAFIMEGKKEGIKVHAWVENFFVGRYDHIEENYFYQHKKDWLLINRDGSILQKNEVNYIFLDPANKEVRDYVLSLYEEMIQMHPGLESLHLDYIRYPLVYDINPPYIKDDVGYTTCAIDRFKELYQIEGSIDERLTEHKMYQKWTTFKTEIINQFTASVYAITRIKTKLSIAIFGDPDHARKHKMQDWMLWVEKGMIDLIIPMAYYKDDKRVFDEVIKLNTRVSNRAKVYAGIARAYMGLDTHMHYKQLIASRDAGASGVVMFATQNYLTHHFMGETQERSDIKTLFSKIKEEGI
ncbi:MAG: hypothetical protein A2Y45_07975 [Tenericutes bacterium GWC2_34_14]|nr:MAG: hypothetical protein A2Z84_06915 [Tenericutes bacterium GWA2_35_7]OHE29836.1 MAG: hypothetical protein A2Y45_07975 [Tenericutes bacterium GWC2_34_14]OHE34815.1 MAG: hypothetical protein A2012_01585 [Tenericutes bacterium GWE2_34_108]OHE37324.1 MAG: hypothetical protein A2Y46_01425 [Tenericutes bacterium GWF1_35_14]OHE39543.1 MAG: hypothetical protein A2Y44_01435 [Tenericutes bacterium GWF2_35_184]OHE41955.1 MAG: hypothetical protein A3K26_02980 [Tenericutes bacterium RIFOXYA12_FULL_35_